jgi:hypothetical protein
MKRLALVFALALSSLPSAARAQVGVQIQVGLPVAPPLVVVQPGVQVVENYDEEVFFTGGWYWVRRDGAWYRARSPRANFVYCHPRYVPARLVRIPPGQYRHWNRERAHAERQAWKDHEKRERREWKEARKQEKHERHEREHGHH